MENIKIEKSWKEILKDEFTKPYFKELTAFVKTEYLKHKIYPAGKNIFRALDLCPIEKVKVVILGQDPYHGPGQANGLCFSVNENIPLPPSLQNIYKELASDINIKKPTSGNLEPWAKQGILLLNATLTVRAAQANSHKQKGWEIFTDSIIKNLSDKKENLVFILWGNYAKSKSALIDQKKHFIISSPHPSPLSAYAGFFNSKPFSKTNNYLKSKSIKEINWPLN